MSHFLQRLALRALGEAAAVTPRPPSRFEMAGSHPVEGPRAAAEPFVEPFAAAAGAWVAPWPADPSGRARSAAPPPEPPVPPVPPAAAPPPETAGRRGGLRERAAAAAAAGQMPRRRREGPSRGSAQQAPAASPACSEQLPEQAPRAAAPPLRSSSNRPLDRTRTGERPGSGVGAAPRAEVELRRRDPQQVPQRSSAVESFHLPPSTGRSASMAGPRRRRPAGPGSRPVSEPTVTVSIGSIEVRSVQPRVEARPAAAAPRPPGPGTSLADYLRQRREGRR